MNMLQTKKEELKKQGKKGFTLMELLIVVAIIAVLVAIAIPLFTNQLEKAREATDAANIRSAYAEVTVAYLNNDTTNESKTVKATQTQSEWTNTDIENIGGKPISDIPVHKKGAENDDSWTVAIGSDGTVTIK